MSYFEFDPDPKGMAGAGAVDRVNKALLLAVSKRMQSHRMTKTDIAKRLGVDKSVVSRWLRGNQNMTPRTFGEILWALDFDFKIALEDLMETGDNTVSVHSENPKSQSMPHTTLYKQIGNSTSSGSRQTQAKFVPNSVKKAPAVSGVSDYAFAEG